MIFDSGKDVFCTISVATGKPILRTYLSSEGMINRLNKDADIFIESMDSICQNILETTQELNQPTYVLEMVMNESKFDDIKNKLVKFVKEAKNKFFALIDSIICTFNELFRSNKKLITSQKNEIYEKAQYMKNVTFDTWIYNLNTDPSPYSLLSEILDNVFYDNSPYETLMYDGDPSQRLSKDVEAVLGKLIGKPKSNFDTFIDDAKSYIRADKKKRTLDELGGLDYLYNNLEELCKQKNDLKTLKKSFTTFMDNFEHAYELEYYNTNNDPEEMKTREDIKGTIYDSLYDIYKDVTTICNYSMKYLRVVINMTQENISQTIGILNKIRTQKIEQESAVSPISSIIM